MSQLLFFELSFYRELCNFICGVNLVPHPGHVIFAELQLLHLNAYVRFYLLKGCDVSLTDEANAHPTVPRASRTAHPVDVLLRRERDGEVHDALNVVNV